MFFGWTVSSLIIPRISDLKGRKLPFIVSLIVQAGANLILIQSRSYYLNLFGLALMGVCAVGRWTVGWIYLIELVDKVN